MDNGVTSSCHTIIWTLAVNNNRNGTMFWQHLTKQQAVGSFNKLVSVSGTITESVSSKACSVCQITLKICISDRVWSSMWCQKKSILNCFSTLCSALFKSVFCGGVGVWSDQVPPFSTCHKLKLVSSRTRALYALYPHAPRPWNAARCGIQIRPEW